MSLVDLKCQDSISYTNCCRCIDKRGQSLLLGNNYQIYLFFELPPALCLSCFQQARLILFKMPVYCSKDICGCDRYCLFPLLDFFNVYSCIYNPPAVDYSRKVVFYDNYWGSCAEIDITDIVSAWIEEKIENKGLLLTGDERTRYISYASDRNEIRGMRPMLRLNYNGVEICQQLSVLPCKVKVNIS